MMDRFTISRIESAVGFNATEEGFTLFEFLTSIALAAIMALIGLPRFIELTNVFNRVNAKSYLVQDLKRAQAETVTQGCRGVLKINTQGTGYTFGCDYLAYDGSVDPAADKIFFTRNLPARVTLTSTAPVIFNSRGQAVDLSGIITTISLSLYETYEGSVDNFATGTLTGTGVFTY